MKNVLLLRSGSDGDYQTELDKVGWSSRSISPIQKQLINSSQLAKALDESFDGLILTSRTAVEAVQQVRTEVTWPIFVVGEATGRAVRKLLEHQEIIGEDSGDAVRLAPQIIEFFDRPANLLHPGATRMIGGLKEKLAESSIVSNHIPVYETTSRDSQDLVKALSNVEHIDAVVYFSPSGVNSARSLVSQRWPKAQEIAIGISTAKALDNCLVCQHPNARGESVFFLLDLTSF